MRITFRYFLNEIIHFIIKFLPLIKVLNNLSGVVCSLNICPPLIPWIEFLLIEFNYFFI